MDYQLIFKILILWIWYQPQYGHAESQSITTRSAEHLLSTSTEINGKWNVQCVNGVIAWRVYVVNFRDWACIQCDPSPLCIGNQQHFLDRTMKIVITILISFCPGGGLLFEYRPCGTWTLQAYNTCAIFSLRCKLIGLECCIIMNSLNSCNFPVLILGMCTIVSIQKKTGLKGKCMPIPIYIQSHLRHGRLWSGKTSAQILSLSNTAINLEP